MSVYHKFLANRLYQFHRILKQSGNIFVHINVHLSVSVNYIISRIFGNENFRNQYIFPSPVRIVGSPSPDYSVILFYSKSKKFSYNQLTSSPDQEDSIRFFPYKDDRGNYQLKSLIHNLGRKSYKFDWKGITPQKGYSWRYGPEQLDKFFSDGLIDFGLSHNLPALKLYSTPGVPIGSIWNDLDTHFEKDEIVGFPTQKSEKLLARIIKIGTNENNTVFDPFCGSSTTLVASQKLRRKWIGCDISSDACRLSLERLENKLGLKPGQDFRFVEKTEITNVSQQIYKAREDGPFDEIESHTPIIPGKRVKEHSKKQKLLLPLYENPIPIIFTEGKTDWKHLKAAFLRFKS